MNASEGPEEYLKEDDVAPVPFRLDVTSSEEKGCEGKEEGKGKEKISKDIQSECEFLHTLFPSFPIDTVNDLYLGMLCV